MRLGAALVLGRTRLEDAMVEAVGHSVHIAVGAASGLSGAGLVGAWTVLIGDAVPVALLGAESSWVYRKKVVL